MFGRSKSITGKHAVYNDEKVEAEKPVEKKISTDTKEYSSIEERLKQIEQEVQDENLDLDKSLDLYEEAVNLGMKASKAIEDNVLSEVAKQDKTDDVEDSSNN